MSLSTSSSSNNIKQIAHTQTICLFRSYFFFQTNPWKLKVFQCLMILEDKKKTTKQNDNLNHKKKEEA